jgi:dolichol-phosphate mannosyltransferase
MQQIKPSQQLSVIIPMYNEEGNVELLVNEVNQALTHHLDFEIIVVDDGSQDATLQKLNRLTATNLHLRVLRHRRNLGQSVAIFSGVYAATKPWVVTLDGDGQNDPKDIMQLIEAAENDVLDKPLLIGGCRVNRKDSGWKKFGSKFANCIRSRCLKDHCTDSGCGLKLFQKETFLMLPHFNHLHRYLPALFQRAGGKVINVSVSHRPRTSGNSKYGNFSRLKVGIADLFGVAWLMCRPCISELENDTKSSDN